MSREIKFRAWDSSIREMLGIARLDLFSLRSDGVMARSNHDKCTLMQYTGLKDKNGKEIYEGDVLRYMGDTCTVYWCGDFAQFHYSVVGNPYTQSDMFCVNQHCEVTGNIYENPELLE